MTPTIEILERVNRNSQKNKDEVFTKLYRYMLRPDIYYVAYKNLYANSGASTRGVDNDTADGFGEKKIMKIINMLQTESYEPSPSRRAYVNKANGKKRPLGIPTFTDKLVQEVLRMILQAVCEPVSGLLSRFQTKQKLSHRFEIYNKRFQWHTLVCRGRYKRLL